MPKLLIELPKQIKCWHSISGQFALLTKGLLFCAMVGSVYANSADPNNSADANKLDINILYLNKPIKAISGLTNSLRAPASQGLDGVALGIADSNTTGRFLGHHYTSETFSSPNSKSIITHANEWLQKPGNSLIVANLAKQDLLAINNLESVNGDPIVINIRSMDDSLRVNECKPRLLHTIPSRSMLTDALLQFTNYKRWNNILLVQGQSPNDLLYSQSLHRSIKRFGGKVVAEKTWSFDTDLRRAAQKEIPAFTQTKDYDIIFVADEAGYFGNYLLYNSWLPRPVAGTQGLSPKGWQHLVEQWGALQLQNRFRDHAKRWMNDIDYAGWTAVRAFTEAVTRTQSINPKTLYHYLLSSEFELAAFKGSKLSFRNWNGQLRQPIPLVHANGLVSQSPQEGYLHPVSALDTLGYDSAEVDCEFE